MACPLPLALACPLLQQPCLVQLQKDEKRSTPSCQQQMLIRESSVSKTKTRGWHGMKRTATPGCWQNHVAYYHPHIDELSLRKRVAENGRGKFISFFKGNLSWWTAHRKQNAKNTAEGRDCVYMRACVRVCHTEVKVSETTAGVSRTQAKRKLQQQHQLITVTLVHKNLK